MKSRRVVGVIATMLFTLAIPVAVAAQDNATQNNQAKYHHYMLIDVGTLGGPNSSLSGPLQQILDNQGRLAAYSNTAAANPNPGCFIPFNANGGGGDCFVEHPMVWRNGTVTDLGVLPGGTNGQTDALSNNGLISGWSENGLLDPLTGLPEGHAVLWTRTGKIIDLGTVPGGNESLATANNSSGQVVGFSSNDILEDPSISLAGLPTQTRAFLWQNGAIHDLGTLGGTDSLPMNINDRGQVTGFSFTNSDATLDPFLWQNGTLTDIGSLGGTFGIPNWLNRRGQVVGTSNLAGDATNHGFLWDQGTLTDLGTLGGDNSEADWISDSSFVVGRADVPGSQSHHGFRWKNGVMTDLGTIQPWPCSTALSANTVGQVVGETGICGVGGGPAFLSDHGEPIVDVNTLIVPSPGLEVISAADINDRGEISGVGLLSSGDIHAVLLIPCDENHAGVEGCDYSMVDTNTPAQSPTPRYVPGGAQRPPQSRWTNRLHSFSLQSRSISPQSDSSQPASTYCYSHKPIVCITLTPLSPGKVGPGGTSTSTLYLKASGGFNSIVGLSCSVQPSPARAPICIINGLNDGKASLWWRYTMSVNTTGPSGGGNPGTPAGTYTITVLGVPNGAPKVSVTTMLTVQ